MRILMIASEAGPFVRSGGLGDVLSALPSALASAGDDVKVVLPLYRAIDRAAYRIVPTNSSATVELSGSTYRAMLSRTMLNKVEWLFVDQPAWFDRSGLYVSPDTGKDFPDNDIRFLGFVRSALAMIASMSWKPDLIHLHDWQTALVPALLSFPSDSFRPLSATPTVLTLHNVGYQGQFDATRFATLGLPDQLMQPVTGALEFYGSVNWLKGGISLATQITTVSPTYAKEIATTNEFGAGLEGVVASRSAQLHGILNGVDYSVWSPSRDSFIPFKYSAANLARKRMNKVDLLTESGMPVRENVPLFGMVSRLAEQKGFDLLLLAGKALLSRDVQLVVLGSGEKVYVAALEELASLYPDKLKFYHGFDERLSHKIEAAADIYLMPSRYEPCGLNQMYSLKYGAVPIVRAVGGLADTIVDYNESTATGTGFSFADYSPEALIDTVDRALDLFARKRSWAKVVKAGMACDFSWNVAAKAYQSVYRTALQEANSRAV